MIVLYTVSAPSPTRSVTVITAGKGRTALSPLVLKIAASMGIVWKVHAIVMRTGPGLIAEHQVGIYIMLYHIIL